MAGGERVLVQKRDALARRGRLVAEEAHGEVGGLREVRLPDRAERPHRRQVVVVQRADDALGELGSGGREPLRERVREAQRRGAHDVARERRPLGDQVLSERAAPRARPR